VGSPYLQLYRSCIFGCAQTHFQSGECRLMQPRRLPFVLTLFLMKDE
jgi:hypothetical protein